MKRDYGGMLQRPQEQRAKTVWKERGRNEENEKDLRKKKNEVGSNNESGRRQAYLRLAQTRIMEWCCGAGF
jgi:hypothetical protein